MEGDLLEGILAHMHRDVPASVLHSPSPCIGLAGMRFSKFNFQKVTKIILIQIYNEHVSKIYLTH